VSPVTLSENLMVSQLVESYYGVRIRPSFENTRHDHAFVCIGKYQIVSHACAEQNPANRRITSDWLTGALPSGYVQQKSLRRPKSLMSGR
jgi:hypothetical protein